MRSFRLPRFCKFFLASVVAALLASEVPQASAAAFKATFSITETIHETGTTPCVLVGDISGIGTATQLRKTTLVSRDCIIPINETATAFVFFSNEVVLTAANGDQVFARYLGTFTIEGFVGTIVGGYEIVGGTGRYSQATGAGAVQGVEDLTTGKGQVELTGTISY